MRGKEERGEREAWAVYQRYDFKHTKIQLSQSQRAHGANVINSLLIWGEVNPGFCFSCRKGKIKRRKKYLAKHRSKIILIVNYSRL